MHTMRKLSSRGDDVLATYDVTTSPEQLAEIEAEFNAFLKQGYFAADIAPEKPVLIKQFSRNAEIVLIPRVAGG